MHRGSPLLQRRVAKIFKESNFIVTEGRRLFEELFNNVDFGFTARLLAILGCTGAGVFALVRGLESRQDSVPYAQRWYLWDPRVPIEFVERRHAEGDDDSVEIWKFRLPNSYDKLGYSPVSAVQLKHVTTWNSTTTRWYNPVSHPDTPGFVEFAIKRQASGFFFKKLDALNPGDVIYMGRWMKEFQFQPNTYGEVGIVFTPGAISVALQLMNFCIHQRQRATHAVFANHSQAQLVDHTKLRLLYCAPSWSRAPFKKTFFDAAEAYPDMIQTHMMLSRSSMTEIDPALRPSILVGLISAADIRKAMPPPLLKREESNDGAVIMRTYRPALLIAGPNALYLPLCGKSIQWWSRRYLQGLPWQYSGILREEGYKKSQVYRFGADFHWARNPAME
jgi:hypothetical protein